MHPLVKDPTLDPPFSEDTARVNDLPMPPVLLEDFARIAELPCTHLIKAAPSPRIGNR